MQTHAPIDPPEVRAGLVLGRYELLVPIAAGGMAQVWAARMKGARQFQKIVAVKTMLPKLSEDAQFEQMFLDEASLASQIKHPNAVEILDLGDQDGILFLVMEWIEGVPLNHLMKAAKGRGGIPTAIAARIAMQACAGLHAAHELTNDKGEHVGLVHRDVSPQNLLVTFDGVTKVVDFGVAKATALGGGATQAGQVKGKVSYMAPEQVNGEGLDRRADVFALGIVLYALTTGKHPFRRESEAATMYNICSPDPVVPPSAVVDGYAPELEPIVLKALAKNRDDRYPSCDAFFRALGQLPMHLRVGSDADVGRFVQDLLGDRRAEQKRRLDEALARADANPNGNWTTSGSVATRLQMSTISGTGTQELSGLASGIHPQTLKNRILGAAGLVALAVSGGALAVMVLDRGDDPPQEVRIIEAPDVKTGPAATTPSADKKEGVKSATGDAVGLDSLPEEDETAEKKADDSKEKSATEKADLEPSSNATTVAPKGTGQEWRPPPPTPVAAPATKPAAKPSGDWKMDAGF
jgi:serine/threonine protein kinase